MSKRTIGFIIMVSLICFIGYQGMLSAADKKVPEGAGEDRKGSQGESNRHVGDP